MCETERGQSAKALEKPFAIDSPDLVENDVTGLAAESAWAPEWVLMGYFHRHCFSSKRVAVGSSSRRSPFRDRSFWAASAQPARGFAREAITTAPSRTRTSTSSCRLASSMSGFGRRTPDVGRLSFQ